MDRTVRFWNARWNPGVTLLPSAPGESFREVGFGAENRRVLALSPDLAPRLFDADRASREAPPPGDSGEMESSIAQALCPGGSHYALALPDGKVAVFDARSQTLEQTLEGFRGRLSRLAISAGGERLATGSRRGPLYSLDLAGGTRVEIELEHYMEALAISADGSRIALVQSDNRIRLFDAASGELLATSGRAHSQAVTKLTFSGDGERLASSSRDGTARLWQLPELAFLGPEMEGRGEALTSVSISNANRRVATGSARGRIQIWSLESRELLYSERVTPEPILDLEFSPDGKRLAISSGPDGIRVLESGRSAQRYGIWSGQGGEGTAPGAAGPR